MKFVKYAVRILLVVILTAVAGFVVWGSMPLGPDPEALAALQSDTQVEVTSGQWLVFEPATGEADLGFIFYPGGRVDYRSYAPLAHRIAAEGYRVIIVPMPLNLAVFTPGRAAQVIQAYPEIGDWVIGGHSLGGAMAANYVYRHPQAVQGLVLWASFPASNNSLSELDIPCLSIYGSQDGEVEKIRESAALLPADTRWVEIVGGNHAQFGWYGPQAGDGQATIGHDEQQAAILTATLDFLATFPQYATSASSDS